MEVETSESDTGRELILNLSFGKFFKIDFDPGLGMHYVLEKAKISCSFIISFL